MKINGILHEYAKTLGPSDDQIKTYNEVIQRLITILHHNSRFAFQLRPAGSFAKKSSIAGKMDLDLIVLINEQATSFEPFLSDLEDVLLNNSHLKEDDIAKSQLTLQFSWPCSSGDEDIDIDLVMGINFVPNTTEVHDVCFEQYRRVMQAIRKWRNRNGEFDPIAGGRFYSSSLTEPVIEFVRTQSASTHELIRLVKLWKNSIYFSTKILGLSSTMEIIGSYIGMTMEMECGSAFLMVDAVRRFLEVMKDLENANIIFSREKMRGRNLFYSNADIPQSILCQRPLILDPVNPYNNRLNVPGLDNDVFRLLSGKADVTLTMLNQIAADHGNRNQEELFKFVVNILFPGPFQSSSSRFSGRMGIPKPITSAVSSDCVIEPKPRLIRRKSDPEQEKYADFCLKMYDMVMKSNRVCLSDGELEYSVSHDGTRVSQALGHPVAKALLERTMNTKFGPANINENDYDYTMVVPCVDGRVKIHFKW